MTRLSSRRVRAMFDKDLREYRRDRTLMWGMAVVPLLFCVQPLVAVFALGSAASATLRHEHVLLYMLGIPALVPSFVASYSIVGERDQGTLEPMLSTPIRRRELILGKAAAVMTPTLIVAYAVFSVFVLAVYVFAAPGVAESYIRIPDVLAQIVFTPLLAGWSIWVGMWVSSRAKDVRVAQQFSVLGVLPSILVIVLVAVNVIHASLALALAAFVVLAALNALGWRLVAASLDREQLIVGVGAPSV